MLLRVIRLLTLLFSLLLLSCFLFVSGVYGCRLVLLFYFVVAVSDAHVLYDFCVPRPSDVVEKCDMCCDRHKSHSDVLYDFVSVTKKLLPELSQCYNVLPQLQINNAIAQRS